MCQFRTLYYSHSCPFCPTRSVGQIGGQDAEPHRRQSQGSRPGKHQDGQGLYLRVTESGSKSWVLRITIDGRRRDMGLGGWPDVALADARSKAAEYRSAVADGRNPLAEKRRSDIPMFRDAAQAVYDANRQRWRSDRHAKLWWASLENHVFPVIGDMRVDRVTQSDVLRCVEPIWTTRPEAARKVRQRIRTALRW